jgi:hypothetical protein
MKNTYNVEYADGEYDRTFSSLTKALLYTYNKYWKNFDETSKAGKALLKHARKEVKEKSYFIMFAIEDGSKLAVVDKKRVL